MSILESLMEYHESVRAEDCKISDCPIHPKEAAMSEAVPEKVWDEDPSLMKAAKDNLKRRIDMEIGMEVGLRNDLIAAHISLENAEKLIEKLANKVADLRLAQVKGKPLGLLADGLDEIRAQRKIEEGRLFSDKDMIKILVEQVSEIERRLRIVEGELSVRPR